MNWFQRLLGTPHRQEKSGKTPSLPGKRACTPEAKPQDPAQRRHQQARLVVERAGGAKAAAQVLRAMMAEDDR